MHPMPEPISSSNPTPPPSPGMVLAGKYRLEESLGSGGMAEVFRALEISSGRRVAVKVLRAGPDQNPEATARLKREGQVLRSLKNPAIVGIEEVIELDGGRVVLVMELLVGETLGARMRRGKIEPAELSTIVAGVAVGLSAAHANGVVHRDLKPENIFLGAHPDGRVHVKLLDFGVSKIFGGERLTQTGQVLGTPRYMSPEQLGAEPEVDHRVDIYSLGVILYEALSGKPPFLASTPTDLIVAILHGKVVPLRSLRPDLPQSIEGVVMRAMARVRDARFRAATELADAFLEASGIAANARTLPRAGMATTPLGSMKTGEPGNFDVAAAAALHAANVAAAKPASPPVAVRPVAPMSADPLAPGTFSELPAFDEAKIRADAAVAATQLSAPHPVQPREREIVSPDVGAAMKAPLAATAPATDVAARAIPRTAISMMEVPAPTPLPIQPTPMAAPYDAGYLGPGSTSPLAAVRRDPSGMSPSANVSIAGSSSIAGAPAAVARVIEPESPARGRLILAMVGLAAGAISAGVAIAVLTWVSANRDADRPPPPPPPSVTAPDASTAEPTTTTTTTTTTEPTTTTEATTAPTTEATTTEATTTTTPTPPTTPTTHPHHTTHTHTTTTAETTPDHAPIDPFRDPIGAAEQLLTGHEPAPDRCQAIIEHHVGAGDTPIALKRRGDCLMRAGRREEAIADYQHFCRIAPDHPSIGEVRETLEGMGQTCP
jgi:hypothetical protein